MIRNTLLTYPRTGTTWTEARFVTWSEARKRMGFEKAVWWQTHAGYHPMYYEYSNNWRFKKPGQVFVLVRDAVKTIVSNWYWIKKNHNDWKYYDHEEYKTLESYIPYGTRRYACFLNWLNDLDLGAYYFYEDIGTRDWEEREIPRILGQDGTLDQSGWECMKATNEISYNSVDADHNVGDNLRDQIREIIMQNCLWQPYLERYEDSHGSS